ncbi:prepilin-type N-terminal cleavage/methylation domain-containing protein [Candidatus Peregrinibacteria bacterium]|nr:prepilin-type N-terminal cleavage/methylation domain-containing protein [Candidatus Peregrinibacteria bacterium]
MFNFQLSIRKKKIERGGFTLVEILVVMGIIAMLSTLAVNGYLSYRRSALLDLGADNLVSQINAMKARATYGSNSSGQFEKIKNELQKSGQGASESSTQIADKPQCYGVAFEKNAAVDSYSVKSFSVDFDNRKFWNPDTQNWEYKACGNYDSASALDISLDSQMQIFRDYTPNAGFVLRFLPPNGKLEVVNIAEPTKVLDGVLKMKLRYGTDSDPNYQREINLDLLSGKFTVKNV